MATISRGRKEVRHAHHVVPSRVTCDPRNFFLRTFTTIKSETWRAKLSLFFLIFARKVIPRLTYPNMQDQL